jgi:putative DNA primase/helicase
MAKSRKKHYACTDLGNVDRFVDQHKDRIMATGSKHSWLIWDGARWQASGDRKAYAMAVETVESIVHEIGAIEDIHALEELRKWAKQSQAEARIQAILAGAAKSEKLYADPATFDLRPDEINTKSGPINLVGGSPKSVRPESLFTKTTAVPFKETEICASFETFVDEIFGFDTELVDWMQRAIGYSLTGLTTEQVLFVAYGTGANGKSTLFELLQKLLGDYSKMADFETFVTGNKSDVRTMEAIGELKGIRFALASEIDSARRFDEALIKKLTGGDTLRGTTLRSSAFQFTPQFKLWLLTNHLPFARDGSHGFWRRIKVVPFTQTFRGDQLDTQLFDKLWAEREGILKWCVSGAMKYYAQLYRSGGKTGLGPCKAVDQATETYRYDNDTVMRFISEEVEVVDGHKLTARDLFRAYESWSFDQGIKHPITEQIFSRRMEERGYLKKRTSEAMFYLNLKLKPSSRPSF